MTCQRFRILAGFIQEIARTAGLLVKLRLGFCGLLQITVESIEAVINKC